MATIVERYHQRFRKSGELFERGRTLVAGGGHQSRIGQPHLVYVERAQGALKWDVDGNELVDYSMGYGALLLGHAHPRITEATLLALRLARAYTGRSKVVKLREHFHGWHDYVSPQSGINTQSGIPQETVSTVAVVEPKISEVERLLSRDQDIAAVILEPTGGHFGQFPLPNPGFLQELREVTARHGVVMIMDEVITGFRMSRGGAQGRFQVLPDLTTMAKIVAGGLPGGAVAGKADIVDLVASEDASTRVAHPGTYNGNPLSATAGIACLELVAGEPINERADAMAGRLERGLRDALAKMEVAGHIHGIASIVHVVLGAECDCGGDICTLPHSEIARATGAQPEPGGLSATLKQAMLNEGVDMMGGIAFMVSAVHSEEQIDRTAEAFERALAALREERLV